MPWVVFVAPCCLFSLSCLLCNNENKKVYNGYAVRMSYVIIRIDTIMMQRAYVVALQVASIRSLPVFFFQREHSRMKQGLYPQDPVMARRAAHDCTRHVNIPANKHIP